MFGRKKMGDEDVAREREEQRKDREAVEHLRDYSSKLGRAEALEVEGERGTREDIPLPDDLSSFKLEGNRSVTAKGIDMIALESLLEDATRRGMNMDPDRTRALNNLVQVEHVGNTVIPRASIMLPISRERESMFDEIREKKNALLREILGQEEAGRVDMMKTALAEQAKGPEWGEGLEKVLQGVDPVLRSTPELLEAMKFFQKNYLVDEAGDRKGKPTSLEEVRNRVERLKKIEAAEEAFRTGDPTTVSHADPFMENLVRGERVRRTDLNQRRTAVAYGFYRGKIRDILRTMNVSSVEESS